MLFKKQCFIFVFNCPFQIQIKFSFLFDQTYIRSSLNNDQSNILHPKEYKNYNDQFPQQVLYVFIF